MSVRVFALLLSIFVLAPITSALAQDAEVGDDGAIAEAGDDGVDGFAGDEDADDFADDDGFEADPDDGIDDDEGGPKLITVALLAGYGLNLDSEATGDLNPFGLGFGARGGYNIGRIYVGGRVAFYLGDSEQVPGGEISANQLTVGLVGGYDSQMGGMTVRAELGLGMAIGSGETSFVDASGMVRSSDSSSEDIYLAPGATLIYPIAEDVFLGGEAALPIILADPETVLGLTLMLSAGMAF